MTAEPLNCPFCGANIDIDERTIKRVIDGWGNTTDANLYTISCKNCEIPFISGFRIDELIAAWNRRVERLERLLQEDAE